MSVSIGSDPEFFLADKAGRFVSAIGKVKGTKENKIDLPGGAKLFYDNVLAEMNIVPAEDEDHFLNNIRTCLTQVSRHVSPCQLVQQASMEFPAEELQHPDAKVFGCDPEFCAYELKQIIPPTCETTFRSAGGHIHLGAKEGFYPLTAAIKEEGTCPDGDERKDRDWGRVWVVRMMDLFVGLPSILIDLDPTTAARRKLYGKAGSHRPKEEYGVEYRATGNFWLRTPSMATLIYRLSMFTVDFVAERRHEALWTDENTCKAYDVNQLRSAIDNTDKKLAGELMENVVKKHLPKNIWDRIFNNAESSNKNFLREWSIA